MIFSGDHWAVIDYATSDASEIWLSEARKPYPWPGNIAPEIIEHTQAQPLAVVQAMGIAHPEPALPPDQEINSLVSELVAANDPSPYPMSKIQALAWELGTATVPAPAPPGTLSPHRPRWTPSITWSPGASIGKRTGTCTPAPTKHSGGR